MVFRTVLLQFGERVSIPFLTEAGWNPSKNFDLSLSVVLKEIRIGLF